MRSPVGFTRSQFVASLTVNSGTSQNASSSSTGPQGQLVNELKVATLASTAAEILSAPLEKNEQKLMLFGAIASVFAHSSPQPGEANLEVKPALQKQKGPESIDSGPYLCAKGDLNPHALAGTGT